jgi:hypothetical protein
MTAEEHAALATLPDPATPYRGITFFPGDALKYARGMSWTDDLDIAAHFAFPYPEWLAGAVLKARVPRWRVLAYFQERGEHEVVIDPRGISYCVHSMPIEEVLDRSPGRGRVNSAYPVRRLGPDIRESPPLKPNSISAAVSLLLRRLKLPKGASLHSLRHSHCSHLLASGVPLPAVSARLGRGSIWTTEEIYSHMIHGQDDEAARKWEEFQEPDGRKTAAEKAGAMKVVPPSPSDSIESADFPFIDPASFLAV